MGRMRYAAPAAVVAGLVVLGGAGTALARTRTTLVAGYVSTGAPVSGASVRVYGPRGRRLRLAGARPVVTTDAAGFFVLALPGHPRSVRLVAAGGRVRGVRVRGSLSALVARPGPGRTAIVTPVSTVIAAYRANHPRASLPVATRRGRRLLGLAPGGAAGRGLLGVTRSFDGLAFLRIAQAHGGLQRYVARLVARGKPVAFRGPRLVGGWDEYVKLITNAKDAIGGVYSIGKTVYDIFNWVKGKEDREGQIWEAVQRMQKQLDDIQASLSQMRQQIDAGFLRIEHLVSVSTYNAMVRPLKELAGTVASAQDAFTDLINNAVSPDYDAEYASRKMSDLRIWMADIIRQFRSENDVFHDSLLKGGLFTTPTYSFAAKALLVETGDFMTPTDSAQLQNFAGYMLQYQALAFNLIVRWETKPGSVSTTLAKAIKLYLGFDTVQRAREWLETEKPEVPATGDLSAELSYLDTIRPVPAHTVVDSFGTDRDTGTGLMWSYKPLKFARFDLRNPIRFPPGMYCGGGYQSLDSDWCPYMATAWNDLKRQLTDYADTFGKQVGLSGWEAPQPGVAATALKRISTIPNGMPRAYYWTPVEFKTTEHHYQQLCDDYSRCRLCPEDTHCGWVGGLIDTVSVPVVESSGNRVSCTIEVGDKERRGTYFPEIGKRADCPLLAPIIERRPAAEESYWPQLPAGQRAPVDERRAFAVTELR